MNDIQKAAALREYTAYLSKHGAALPEVLSLGAWADDIEHGEGLKHFTAPVSLAYEVETWRARLAHVERLAELAGSPAGLTAWREEVRAMVAACEDQQV